MKMIESLFHKVLYKKYYAEGAETKDLNLLTDGDTPIKHKQEAYEKIIEIGRNDDYTTGILLDYKNFSKHQKLIMINLSKQIELKNPNLKYQTNAIDRLDENNATIFFIIKKSEEKYFGFSHNAVNVT